MTIDKGSATAMNNYGSMLGRGDGITMNKKEEIKYYKIAIEKGDSSAMVNYIMMLYSGDGISMDKT